MIQIQSFVENLQLESLYETKRTDLDITVPDINRPGIQLCDYYEYFTSERVQVVGKVEMAYIEQLDGAERRRMLEKYMSFPLPCIIITWNMNPPSEFIEIAKEHDIPLFRSKLKTTRFILQTIMYLNRELAPHVTQHGVLVDVYGVGVLLTGDSGVGKSEAALELIKRGHQLCADDVVDICRVTDDRLIGESPEMVRHFMEIRGIGIIDIRAMYGISAVVRSKSIDMVIHLEKWNPEKTYDRFGLVEETTDILGVAVPYQVMPVKPGRNLAIIIEVAARNLSLKRMGYSAAMELDRRLNELIRQSSEQAEKENATEERK